MIDCNFPIVRYVYNQTSLQHGIQHGEELRDAIKELAQIRKELMLARNPEIIKYIPSLAKIQFAASEKLNPALASEMEGIAKGSNLTLEDIIILNNYTDFRDIELPEEGCSTLAFNGDEYGVGQTWDMHASAKNYVSLIEIENRDGIHTILFSLVGCLGMMGINQSKCFVGVNNINTRNANASVIWPLLVRHLLQQNDVNQMYQILQTKPVTSGHNYLIADGKKAFHLEVSPNLFEEVSSLNFSSKSDEKSIKTPNKSIFHTNHCLGEKTEKIEMKDMISSTTHARIEILKSNVGGLDKTSDLKKLLTSHEQYPKSICSHFESGAQDPSFTCGGGVVNLDSLECEFWRGCPTEDQNFKSFKYYFKDNHFLAEQS